MIYLIWLIYLLIGEWTPWWSSLALVFLAGWFASTRHEAFKVGLVAGGLIALLLIGYFNFRGHNIVATKLAAVFGGLPSTTFYIAVSAIFGLIHSLFSLCGFEVKDGYTVLRSRIKTKPKSQSDF